MFYSLAFLLLVVFATISYEKYLRTEGKGGVGKKRFPRIKRVEHPLHRAHRNPLISPTPYSHWQSECAFNPAVVQDEEGKVHLIYRAIGSDGVSRFGYAASKDGFNFDERCPYPVFEAAALNNPNRGMRRYDPKLYPSGGSWGGFEDPRTVLINGRVYMTFIAFGGWQSIRIGLTSIALSDLKQKKWNWKEPFFISPEGERHKNWVLFPEKINGKYAIFHGIAPKIYVDYVDSLTEPFTIQSPRPEGPQPGRKDFWDNRMRGIGPPPIKTGLGWLVLYHAIDKIEPHKYKLGAMVLDLHDPTKVLYRSPEPILSPDMDYENDGKPGIVYASGAVVRNNILYVYYGGGDKHVCIAQTPLNELLDYLVRHGQEV
ncbi:MAG: hypothetical protein QG653_236 [Patescibacteria group bacterium]|nr:hypothetical protein [Patescibacteria group bacterium]